MQACVFSCSWHLCACLPSDLDEGAAAPTSTTALEPAVNGDAAADTTDAAATDAAAAAEAEAAEVASFFKRRDGEAAVEYAIRIFERLYMYDIEKVISMEVRISLCRAS